MSGRASTACTSRRHNWPCCPEGTSHWGPARVVVSCHVKAFRVRMKGSLTTPLLVSSAERAYARRCEASARGLRLAVSAVLDEEAASVERLALDEQLPSCPPHFRKLARNMVE